MSPELTTALTTAHRNAQLAASSAREALSYAQTALRKAQEAADEADAAVVHIARAFNVIEQESAQ
jgi:hypothetical protein